MLSVELLITHHSY